MFFNYLENTEQIQNIDSGEQSFKTDEFQISQHKQNNFQPNTDQEMAQVLAISENNNPFENNSQSENQNQNQFQNQNQGLKFFQDETPYLQNPSYFYNINDTLLQSTTPFPNYPEQDFQEPINIYKKISNNNNLVGGQNEQNTDGLYEEYFTTPGEDQPNIQTEEEEERNKTQDEIDQETDGEDNEINNDKNNNNYNYNNNKSIQNQENVSEAQKEDMEYIDKWIETQNFMEEEEKFSEKEMVKDYKISDSKRLEQMIEKVLQGEELKDELIQQLNDEQLVIVYALKQKKFGSDQQLQQQQQLSQSSEQVQFNDQMKNLQINSDEFIQQQRQKKQQEKKGGGKKRQEELQKMFFKKAFKYIENNYFETKCKKSTQKKKRIHRQTKNFQDFYKFYFSKVAQKMKISIDNYYHPQKYSTTRKKGYKNLKNMQSQQKQKSFNQAYIDLTLRSDLFRNEVQNYLENVFKEELFQERIQKIEKFAQKCIDIQALSMKKIIKMKKANLEFQYSQIKDQYLIVKEDIENYILRNSKCKIPWADYEILEVHSFAQKYLNEFKP